MPRAKLDSPYQELPGLPGSPGKEIKDGYGMKACTMSYFLAPPTALSCAVTVPGEIRKSEVRDPYPGIVDLLLSVIS